MAALERELELRAELAYLTNNYVSNLVAATQRVGSAELEACIRVVWSLRQDLDCHWLRRLQGPVSPGLDRLRAKITRDGKAAYCLEVETPEGSFRYNHASADDLRGLLVGDHPTTAASDGGNGTARAISLGEGALRLSLAVPAEEFGPALRRALVGAGLQ